MNQRRHVALFLPDSKNPYMQLSAELASVAAAELKIDLDAEFAEGDFTAQVRHVSSSLRALPRPRVVMVMPIQESSLNGLSEQAVAAGVGWFWLSRTPGNHHELRRRHPGVPVSFITPDQCEAGRIQAFQVRAILNGGGRLLWVQGRAVNQSTQTRTAGTREVLQATPGLEIVGELDGNWTAEDAFNVVRRWLRMASSKVKPDLIACQSDLMAGGVLQALETVAADLGDQSFRRIPVLGCDGLRASGRRMVDEGRLAATIMLPTAAERGIRLAAAFLDRGEAPPPEVVLAPQAYPDEATMLAAIRTRHIA